MFSRITSDPEQSTLLLFPWKRDPKLRIGSWNTSSSETSEIGGSSSFLSLGSIRHNCWYFFSIFRHNFPSIDTFEYIFLMSVKRILDKSVSNSTSVSTSGISRILFSDNLTISFSFLKVFKIFSSVWIFFLASFLRTSCTSIVTSLSMGTLTVTMLQQGTAWPGTISKV